MRRSKRTLKDLAFLGDSTRHAIYSLLHELRRALTAHEIATLLDISPKLSRFHLETLLERGLLRAHYSRPTGRAGPGAGRPSKLYEPADQELHASVPPRDYQLAGSILVDAVASASNGSDPKRNAIRIARARGRQLAKTHGSEGQPADTMSLLEQVGYEPSRDPQGDIVLMNCPFHQLAEQNRSLVCSINKAFVEGVASEQSGVRPKLQPEPQRCCVVLEQLTKDKER